jgi:hypothetical protein
MQPVLMGCLPPDNSLQSVAQFKSFLLSNDSQFIEFINSEMLVHILDTQLMKESMISFMAQLMKNGGPQKDNFYIKTRSAIQDTVALYYVMRQIASNNQLEFYLPSFVEMVSDLVDSDRCTVYLYDRLSDELYCKVITGRLKRQISFKRTTDDSNILCRAFNTGKPQHLRNA